MYHIKNKDCDMALHLVDSIESNLKALHTIASTQGSQPVLEALSDITPKIAHLAAAIEQEAEKCSETTQS